MTVTEAEDEKSERRVQLTPQSNILKTYRHEKYGTSQNHEEVKAGRDHDCNLDDLA